MTQLKLHRHLILLLATLWTSICLALPAPHDIEQAVANGQLPQAERMLREVIAEKPSSARARYELAQVLAREGQYTEALQAIRSARELDSSLKFAQSPEKFNAVAQAIEQHASAKVAPAAAHTPVASPALPAQPTQASWLWPAVLTGGFALLALWLWRRVQAQPTLQPQPAGMGSYPPETPRGFGAQYDPRGPVAAGYGTPYPATAPSAGSGVAGAVVGGLAGVAAGYALSKALEGHDHSAGANPMGTSRINDPMQDTGLVRMDPGADLGGFDAGSGDDWGGGDSGGSDDNW
jgi:uncharacterized protein